eukprot:gene17077-23494_t
MESMSIEGGGGLDEEDLMNDITGAPNGEFVMMIGKLVALLVGFVAVILAFMIMMLIRAVISFLIFRIGISGITILAGGFVWGTIKYVKIDYRLIWTLLTKSCS